MTVSTAPKMDARVTPPAVLSFPALFQPRLGVDKTKPAKFSAVLIVRPEDAAALKPIKIDCMTLLQTMHGADVPTIESLISAGKVFWPFSPVTDEVGYPKGGTIIRASSNFKPNVVSRYAKPGTTEPMPITDPDKIFPGCLVRASIRPYLFGYTSALGKKGVTFNLNNVQLLDDTLPRLDNRRTAAQDFGEADEAPVAAMPTSPPAPGNLGVSPGSSLLD
jgi:hypothetical protein